MKHITWNINQIDKKEWDAFVQEHAPDGGLLQSWEWGEVARAEGASVTRLVWRDSGQIVAVSLCLERSLRFGWRYVYVPRGPIIKISNFKSQIADVMQGIRKFAKERGAVFLRVEPPYDHGSWNMEHGTWRRAQSIQPQKTSHIDLLQSEEDLLRQMHQKTRYNVRLAERHGVVTEHGTRNTEHRTEIFWRLLKETKQRDQFSIHSREHYEHVLQHLDADVFVASYKGTALAAALIAYFGNTAYYLHGASANAHRGVMAPYALHWEVMRHAKKRGCTVYDLWGVDEKRWPGVTRFKKGFSPATVYAEYMGAYDTPIRYWAYQGYRVWKLLR